MDLHLLFPFTDRSVPTWSVEARLLRWLTLLWVTLGLVVLYSASYPVAAADHGDGLYFCKRQILGILVGLVVFNTVVHTSLERTLKISPYLFFGCLSLLLVTLVPHLGTQVNGAARWLVLGPVEIQPSELIKPFLLLQGAWLFGRWRSLNPSAILVWLGLFGLMLLAILMQPNLSNTALCGMTLWLIALGAGLPFTYLGLTALSGILVAGLSISVRSYQRRRVMSFLDPFADPEGDGYQLVQSLLAVGSGGLWGSGFGLSAQKLFYLPIQYTDFIFAVFAEEFGLLGCLALLVFLVAYATLCLRIALRSQQLVHRLITLGGMVLLVGQALLNIGVATGALPTTGLPFPLFSYGINSVVSSLMIAGLIVRVARESSLMKTKAS